ncbi:YceI family protein [Telmatospirillum siberiense]|nr:YceI family protein [Telmatospirillum siberiense]
MSAGPVPLEWPGGDTMWWEFDGMAPSATGRERIPMWRAIVLVFILALAVPARAAPSVYEIGPYSTEIGFAVDLADVTTVAGAFTRFTGKLSLDLDAPQASRVAVTVDTRSFDIGWEPAYSLLRSDAYLDVLHWPAMSFSTETVSQQDATHVRMAGTLTIRGVARPQVLDAVLEQRHWDPDSQAEIAVFTVTGILHRSDFGMVSDALLVGDEVNLNIKARLRLAGAEPAR